MNQPKPLELTLAGAIAHAAGVIASEGFPTGDRAALRRMVPGHPPPLAFYRFALRHLPESWEHHRDDWMALVAGMALMSPSAHQPGRGLGRVLAEAGFSEARLERLLASEGDTRRILLLRATRFLSAKAGSFDWSQGARLLLTRDKDKREGLYQQIARDFYQQQGRE